MLNKLKTSQFVDLSILKFTFQYRIYSQNAQIDTISKDFDLKDFFRNLYSK